VQTDRLSSLDVAFLSLERQDSPMHLGAAAVFRPAGRVNPIRLVDLLAERAAKVPRLRDRALPTWLPPGGAVWSRDPRFDPARHIHLHRLPAPGDRDQLASAVSAAMARSLDLARPLWEIHLFTGLQDGSFVVLTKLHHALADGLRAVQLGMSLLDEVAAEPGAPSDSARLAGAARPAGAGTAPAADREQAGQPVLAAARSAGATLARPDRLLVGSTMSGLSALSGLPGLAQQAGQALGIAASMVRSAAPPPARSPWVASDSPERGLVMLRLDLSDVRRIRRRLGGTAHDVLLAVLTGALRRWLTGRGAAVDDLGLRALIPVSRRQRGRAAPSGGNALSGYLCTLPVGEPDPLARLNAIRAEMDRNKAAGPGRGPGALPVLADRLPPAVHRLAGPFAGLGASLLFDTVVTNVPVPSLPLRLAGADLREVYPIVPLAHGQALGVAVSTYRGTVHLTLHADRQALPDLGELAESVPAALAALDRVQQAS